MFGSPLVSGCADFTRGVYQFAITVTVNFCKKSLLLHAECCLVHVKACPEDQLVQYDDSVDTTAPCFVFLMSLTAIRPIKHTVWY